jgi:threonine dehydrogenase-like Zn-dependent dehydrogenase
MRGVTFLGDRQVGYLEVPDPSPGPGEVVVEVHASGLCGSDLHQYRAPTGPSADGVIAGHEPAGVVVAVGQGVPETVACVGDRVMVHHYVGCGACVECRTGWTQMCRRGMGLVGTTVHGSHAPFLRVPASTLVALPEGLTFIAGAAISCGTGTAWGGLRRLGALGGASLVVFGQGPVGLSATMIGAALGARVIAIDLAEERLAMASRFGAAATINPQHADVEAQVREFTRGVGAPFALETSGSSVATEQALGSLAPWGRLCLVGLGGEVRFLVGDHLSRQATIMLSWSMSSVEQQRCAEFVCEQALPVDSLFTHRWSLEEATEAYIMFDRQSAGKAAFIL